MLILVACSGPGPTQASPAENVLKTTAQSTAQTSTPSQTATPATSDASAAPQLVRYDFRIIDSFPHDENAFTQGFLFHDGHFYESTGQYGQSSIRKIVPGTGEIVRQRALDAAVFGEGMALVNDRLVSLSWKSGKGFVHQLDDFTPLDGFSYAGEGWGLTYDGNRLIMSDGSATLRFLDPETFREIVQVSVTLNGKPIRNINELEWVEWEGKPRLFANLWQTDWIAIIDPDTGIIVGLVDLSKILTSAQRAALNDPYNANKVLNGIAYDSQNNRLFVTGKQWPKVFEITLQARPE